LASCAIQLGRGADAVDAAAQAIRSLQLDSDDSPDSCNNIVWCGQLLIRGAILSGELSLARAAWVQHGSTAAALEGISSYDSDRLDTCAAFYEAAAALHAADGNTVAHGEAAARASRLRARIQELASPGLA
jgi:hypothetical protein